MIDGTIGNRVCLFVFLEMFGYMLAMPMVAQGEFRPTAERISGFDRRNEVWT